MSKEDKDLARKMAQTDFEKTATFFRQASPNNQILGYDSDGMDCGGPEGDGDRLFVPVTIGGREHN